MCSLRPHSSTSLRRGSGSVSGSSATGGISSGTRAFDGPVATLVGSPRAAIGVESYASGTGGSSVAVDLGQEGGARLAGAQGGAPAAGVGGPVDRLAAGPGQVGPGGGGGPPAGPPGGQQV